MRNVLLTNALVSLGKQLLSEFGDRESVLIALGYFPGARIWNLKSTYGLPLVISTAEIIKAGYKVDWDGIRLAAYREGSDIDAEVEETQRELALIGLLERKQ